MPRFKHRFSCYSGHDGWQLIHITAQQRKHFSAHSCCVMDWNGIGWDGMLSDAMACREQKGGLMLCSGMHLLFCWIVVKFIKSFLTDQTLKKWAHSNFAFQQ